MQLFITHSIKHANMLEIHDSDVLFQLRKVLRAKIGDTIWVQAPTYEDDPIRYELSIQQRTATTLQGTIISEQVHHLDSSSTTMIVAMPNKWDKVELIVQKLSEIGVQHIIFWPTERSLIKERNPNKTERIQKIIKEAVEQSRGRVIPDLLFTHDIGRYIADARVIVFDKTDTKDTDRSFVGRHVVGIIGPEGGLTPKDHQSFTMQSAEVVGLGDTVLRMETAAIVGAWMIKNR